MHFVSYANGLFFTSLSEILVFNWNPASIVTCAFERILTISVTMPSMALFGAPLKSGSVDLETIMSSGLIVTMIFFPAMACAVTAFIWKPFASISVTPETVLRALPLNVLIPRNFATYDEVGLSKISVLMPICSMRPLPITAILSDITNASDKLCVTYTAVILSACK